MSDAPVNVQSTGQTVPTQPTGSQPAAQQSGAVPVQGVNYPQQQPQQPAQQSAPAVDPLDAIESLDPDRLEQLEQRIRQARANRPQSLADQIAALQQQLTDTHRGKEQAVDQRKEASAQASQLEDTIAEIKRSLRRTELVEAATVAEFANPQVVADSLIGRDGDVSQLIAEAVKSGGYAMRKPATSAQVAGPQTGAMPGMDPGIAALVAEIRAAHGT